MFSIFSSIYKSLPNLPGFILRMKARQLKFKINYNFDSRFLKEVIRERLMINSIRWDYKTVRNYCSILGSGNMSRSKLCEHLSSALINHFQTVLLYLINDPTSFRDYTQFGLSEIWMPRFLLKVLQLAMCPYLQPVYQIHDLLFVRFDIPEKFDFVKRWYELNDIQGYYQPKKNEKLIPDGKGGQQLETIHEQVLVCPTREEYIDAIVNLTHLSKTAFKDCSIEVGSYKDMVTLNMDNFLNCLICDKLDFENQSTLTVYGNEKLTRDDLFISLILGVYFDAVDVNDDIYNVVRLPLDRVQLLEEMRFFIESEFKVGTYSDPAVASKVVAIPSPKTELAKDDDMETQKPVSKQQMSKTRKRSNK